MTKEKASIQKFIFLVFIRSKTEAGEYIPWEQGALLQRINEYRTSRRYEYLPIDNTTLGRALSKLKGQGKVKKLRWSEPSQGNIWIWTGDNQT